RLDVHPFNVQNEVLVLTLAAHHADGLARADQNAVLHLPGGRTRIHIYPAGKIAAIEKLAERRKYSRRCLRRMRHSHNSAKQQNPDPTTLHLISSRLHYGSSRHSRGTGAAASMVEA